MSLDPAENIGQLLVLTPPNSDPPAEGADHIRTVKRAVQNTFPNFPASGTANETTVTLTPAEINALPDELAAIDAVGVPYADTEPLLGAVNVQEAIDANKANLATLEAELPVFFAEEATPDPLQGKDGDLWFELDPVVDP